MLSSLKSVVSNSVVTQIGLPARMWALLAVALLLVGTLPALAQEKTAPVDDATAAEQASTETGVAGAPAVPASDTSVIPGLAMLAMVIAVFVIPIMIGGYLARKWRMPEHGWRFALAIGSIAAAALVLYQGELKYGPDLSGGITLIYELQDTSAAANADDKTDIVDNTGQTSSQKRELVQKLIAALGERVDPSGTKEVSIRQYGPEQIEIIIPKASQEELDFIEKKIYTAGALEFRITASPMFSENREIIELAKALPPSINEVTMTVSGKRVVVAEWMPYKVEEFGEVDEPNQRVVKRLAGKEAQALVLMNDGYDVKGDYLRQSVAGVDEIGNPIVRFVFDDQGAARFSQLTGRHIPNPSGQEYSLGIILDKRLLSAPSIKSKITSQGEISGINSREEVDFIVGILNAGSLPASLNKDPLSRETISPTLGAETVERSKIAMALCMAISFVFLFLYYRFAGFVACIALAANLLLTLGIMVLFHAAFTLPGLAGLVLSVGMSVDANVLIFERIREERARGAALRMAIRNGYDKALSAIIDSNLTNLITAVVIYQIAPDNVKGFGVTLIIGTVTSLFAAIFLTRVIFDTAERLGTIKELKMSQIIGQTNFDFMGKQAVALVGSLILTAIGLFAVVDRGTDLLNIDFTGGSSVTMVLKDNEKMTFSEVIDELAKTDLKDKNLSLVEVGETGTRFTVSSVEQDIAAVQKTLIDTFGDKLKTYRVETTDIKPIGTQTSAIAPRRQIAARLVNFQTEEPAEVAAPTEDNNGETVADGDAADTPAADETTPAETEATEEASPSETTATEQPPTESTDSEATSAETTEEKAAVVPADFFAGGTSAQLKFGDPDDVDAGVNHETAEYLIREALTAAELGTAALELSNPDYVQGTARRYNLWNVKLAVPPDQAAGVFEDLQRSINSEPVFPMSNKIGGRVADDLRTKAIASVIISFLGIVAYIWFRFHGWTYGVAALVAVVHDVLITLGLLAMSAWVVQSIPGLAQALMLEKFQISLPVVAAFLTLIGYSLNDTIVVFDRIREVKGKSPRLTRAMINQSVNQTLSRTLLTSLTTIFSVLMLYIMGGEGLHTFSFVLGVGIIVGTFSSIFVASPVLLWFSEKEIGSGAKSASQSGVSTRGLAATK